MDQREVLKTEVKSRQSYVNTFFMGKVKNLEV